MSTPFLPCAFFTVVITAALSACDGSGDVVVISEGDDQGQTEAENTQSDAELHQQGAVGYSTIVDGIWPPQPVGVTNVQRYSTSSTPAGDREVKFADALGVAMQDARVVAEIGNRYQVLAVHTATEKNSTLIKTEIEVFNYDNNHVVTIHIDDGNRVSVTTQPAREYQPAESDKERLRAIDMAGRHLLELGYHTGHLTGTALLAHPTAAEFAANGHYFYSQRIVYVTFGAGEGTTPLYRADVNLSSETVHNAGPL